MKKAGELIEQLFNNVSPQDLKRYSGLFTSWTKIAGTDIAAHSRILEFDRNVLYVGVDHPGWMQLINLKKGHILSSLNKKYTELKIKDLRLVLTDGVAEEVIETRFSHRDKEELSSEEPQQPVQIPDDFSSKLARLGSSIEKKWQDKG